MRTRIAEPTHPGGGIRIIAFDVFGAVVDWYTGVALEVYALDRGVDGGQFALDWRAGYAPRCGG